MKELFLTVLRRAKGKYKFKLTTFCIVGNHIHFMMRPEENESLSRIMQWIPATFAINFNDGFHSTVIESFRQYVKTFEYIADNPIKAELVKASKNYSYGGVQNLQKVVYELLEPPNLILKLMFPEVCLRMIYYWLI